ncbi:MAG TPA: hypothetical protein VLB76_26775 [Thermoanaerobaculia bacterium]|jgi:hypothetical protein|nr:hypothetical protein [Thermoanaerobaculia bacterium]
MIQQADYGTLAPLVRTVGWLMSAATAISLSWRRRAKWEPSEEDVSQGPARVGGLLTAVLIAILWTQMADLQHERYLLLLALWLAGATLVSLLVYVFLTSIMVFTQEYALRKNVIAERKIIGGFWLKPKAQEVIAQKSLSVQEVLEGAGNNPDKVWSRPSRGLVKILFILCYMGLIVCGTTALTSVAILLLIRS